jgi:tetratricopeptide (TPR) repeat protein
MKSLEASSRCPRSGCRIAVALALVFCGCSPGGGSAGPKEPARFFEEADRLARAGRPRGAAELLERSLEGARFSPSPAVHGRIAEYYLASGSNQAALRFCEKALSADGRNPAALAIRGEAHRRLVNLDDARSALYEAIELAPGHPRASLSLARLEFRAGKPLGALSLFDTYFSAKEGAADDELSRTARLEYGRALRAAGRYQDSADQLAIALEQEPTRSECYSELAAALYRLKRRKEARLIEGIYRTLSQGSFEEYGVDKMRLQGREAQALAQQASNQQRQRRFLDAFRSHRNALEANKKDARIPGLYARYCLAFRRTREGLDVISAALAAGCRPVSGLLWERGRIETARKDWSAAAEAFRSTLQAIVAENGSDDRQGPGRGQANRFSTQLGLARSLLELGHRGPALEAITAAQKLSPSAWEPSYWRGRWLLSGGDPGPAVEAFEAAEGSCRRQGLQAPDDLAAYKAVASWRSAHEPGALEALVAQLERSPGRLALYAELMGPGVQDAARQDWAREQFAEMKANRARIDQLESRLQDTPLASSAGIYTDLAEAYAKFRERGAYDCLFLASDLDPANAIVLKNLLRIMSRPQEVFFRLRLLRRLLAAEGDSEAALYGMAEIFLKLHVRLDEARKLVQSGLDRHPENERLKALQVQLTAQGAGAVSEGKERP